jgi:hypothetical protein
MNQKSKAKQRRNALNLPQRMFECVGDEVYGPSDLFPYIFKDVGKHRADFFGKELLSG